MPKKFQPSVSSGGGRKEVQPRTAYALDPCVLGERYSYNAEHTFVVGNTVITLAEAVRTIRIRSSKDAWVAQTAEALTVPGTGKEGDRHFLPAGVERELPWFQDEVHVRAGDNTAGGTLTVEGRV